MTTRCIPIYDLSLNLRVGWEAHSLSNIGSNGSNRLLGRRIVRADGIDADAVSGNLLKRVHAGLTTEYVLSLGEPLCAACAVRDGRRAAGLSALEQNTGHPVMRCALCDIHGYLAVKRAGEAASETEETEDVEIGERTETSAEAATSKGKGKKRGKSEPAQQSENDMQTRQSKSSLVEFSGSCALLVIPNTLSVVIPRWNETTTKGVSHADRWAACADQFPPPEP
ncbi:hypothetical protein EKD04_024710, partial [Chloroflexales bacterium ZM16-3]|nr:hypothetical protein [Chloroflexales bacterium ZM16-3]